MSVNLNWENSEFWEGPLVIKKDKWPDGTKREHLTLEVPVVSETEIEKMAAKATAVLGNDQVKPYTNG